MPNLIQQLGREFFFERLQGCYFTFNNELVFVTGDNGAAGIIAQNLRSGASVNVPHSHFDGFSVFKWPSLGYRRLSENIVARVSKNRAYNAGLKDGIINTEYTPASSYLLERRIVQKPGREAVMGAIFRPVWDTPAQLDELFSGDRNALVLNEQTVVEPSMRSLDQEQYDVMHRGAVVGSVGSDRTVRASNTRNTAFIRGLLNV